MKIDFSDKANADDIRSLLSKSGEIQKFDAFLASVPVFDFNNDEHVQMAKGSCAHCCDIMLPGPTILY